MIELKYILLKFLKTMAEDLKRRSYDESGEQKDETIERIDTINELIGKIKTDITEDRG